MLPTIVGWIVQWSFAPSVARRNAGLEAAREPPADLLETDRTANMKTWWVPASAQEDRHLRRRQEPAP